MLERKSKVIFSCLVNGIGKVNRLEFCINSFHSGLLIPLTRSLITSQSLDAPLPITVLCSFDELFELARHPSEVNQPQPPDRNSPESPIGNLIYEMRIEKLLISIINII